MTESPDGGGNGGTYDYAATYSAAYANPSYAMGSSRRADTLRHLTRIAAESPHPTRHLDVGTGRGEALDIGESLGLASFGFEIVPSLLVPGRVFGMKDITDLGHVTADLVTCLDVLEHLEREKIPAALAELWRVTTRRLLLSIAWFPSAMGGDLGDLHLTQECHRWWTPRIKAACRGGIITVCEINERGKHGWWEITKT